jgi:hypothetical protein
MKRALLIIITSQNIKPGTNLAGQQGKQASSSLTRCMGGVCRHHREGQALEIGQNITKLSTKVHQAYAHAQHNTTLSRKPTLNQTTTAKPSASIYPAHELSIRGDYHHHTTPSSQSLASMVQAKHQGGVGQATWGGAGQALGALDQAQPKASSTIIASY